MMSKCSRILHNGSQNHLKDRKRSATEQIEWEDQAYYFLQLSMFGAIMFVPGGHTVNQECCLSLYGIYVKQCKRNDQNTDGFFATLLVQKFLAENETPVATQLCYVPVSLRQTSPVKKKIENYLKRYLFE
jgi:hypothetical protein